MEQLQPPPGMADLDTPLSPLDALASQTRTVKHSIRRDGRYTDSPGGGRTPRSGQAEGAGDQEVEDYFSRPTRPPGPAKSASRRTNGLLTPAHTPTPLRLDTTGLSNYHTPAWTGPGSPYLHPPSRDSDPFLSPSSEGHDQSLPVRGPFIGQEADEDTADSPLGLTQHFRSSTRKTHRRGLSSTDLGSPSSSGSNPAIPGGLPIDLSRAGRRDESGRSRVRESKATFETDSTDYFYGDGSSSRSHSPDVDRRRGPRGPNDRKNPGLLRSESVVGGPRSQRARRDIVPDHLTSVYVDRDETPPQSEPTTAARATWTSEKTMESLVPTELTATTGSALGTGSSAGRASPYSNGTDDPFEYTRFETPRAQYTPRTAYPNPALDTPPPSSLGPAPPVVRPLHDHPYAFPATPVSASGFGTATSTGSPTRPRSRSRQRSIGSSPVPAAGPGQHVRNFSRPIRHSGPGGSGSGSMILPPGSAGPAPTPPPQMALPPIPPNFVPPTKISHADFPSPPPSRHTSPQQPQSRQIRRPHQVEDQERQYQDGSRHHRQGSPPRVLAGSVLEPTSLMAGVKVPSPLYEETTGMPLSPPNSHPSLHFAEPFPTTERGTSSNQFRSAPDLRMDPVDEHHQSPQTSSRRTRSSTRGSVDTTSSGGTKRSSLRARFGPRRLFSVRKRRASEASATSGATDWVESRFSLNRTQSHSHRRQPPPPPPTQTPRAPSPPPVITFSGTTPVGMTAGELEETMEEEVERRIKLQETERQKEEHEHERSRWAAYEAAVHSPPRVRVNAEAYGGHQHDEDGDMEMLSPYGRQGRPAHDRAPSAQSLLSEAKRYSIYSLPPDEQLQSRRTSMAWDRSPVSASSPNGSPHQPATMHARFATDLVQTRARNQSTSTLPTAMAKTKASMIFRPSPTPDGHAQGPQDLLSLGIEAHENGDLGRSATYFERSAREGGGCGAGMLMWGLTLRHGWGCPINQPRGFRWLQKAAESVVEDLDRAVHEEDRRGRAPGDDANAARNELVLAIYELGQCFMRGWGCKKDKPLAVSYFELAAQLGDPDAQQELGFCYAHGKGCKKDLKKAAYYYRLAAEQGYEIMGNAWITKDKYN